MMPRLSAPINTIAFILTIFSSPSTQIFSSRLSENLSTTDTFKSVTSSNQKSRLHLTRRCKTKAAATAPSRERGRQLQARPNRVAASQQQNDSPSQTLSPEKV